MVGGIVGAIEVIDLTRALWPSAYILVSRASSLIPLNICLNLVEDLVNS